MRCGAADWWWGSLCHLAMRAKNDGGPGKIPLHIVNRDIEEVTLNLSRGVYTQLGMARY